jgi:methylenetetrahydrofolate reductase (NADPH)
LSRRKLLNPWIAAHAGRIGLTHSATILAWIARLRDQGIDLPVRVGLAGPATLTGLLRYARICGVAASAQGLARHTGLARHLRL